MPRTRHSSLDRAALSALMERQAGVVARRQILEMGGDDVDIRRLVRRRELTQVHAGVYVGHTGTPTYVQRLWAAILLCWPAAAHRESALVLAGLTRDRASAAATVHVVVDSTRKVAGAPGVSVERVMDARSWLAPEPWPPRVQVELAALKAAADRDPADAVALLADAVQQRTTTVDALRAAVDRLPVLPQRRFVRTVLDDVGTGAFSVLERRFLLDVERAHALPTGERQVRVVGGGTVTVRDVTYAPYRTLVELDGRFGHRDTADRWADLDRDVAAAVSEHLTLRLGWGQVLAPCRVARALGVILRARGWTGQPSPCGAACGAMSRSIAVIG